MVTLLSWTISNRVDCSRRNSWDAGFNSQKTMNCPKRIGFNNQSRKNSLAIGIVLVSALPHCLVGSYRKLWLPLGIEKPWWKVWVEQPRGFDPHTVRQWNMAVENSNSNLHWSWISHGELGWASTGASCFRPPSWFAWAYPHVLYMYIHTHYIYIYVYIYIILWYLNLYFIILLRYIVLYDTIYILHYITLVYTIYYIILYYIILYYIVYYIILILY